MLALARGEAVASADLGVLTLTWSPAARAAALKSRQAHKGVKKGWGDEWPETATFGELAKRMGFDTHDADVNRAMVKSSVPVGDVAPAKRPAYLSEHSLSGIRKALDDKPEKMPPIVASVPGVPSRNGSVVDGRHRIVVAQERGHASVPIYVPAKDKK